MDKGIPVLCEETLASLRELQSESDPHFLARLLEVFLKHVPEQLVRIEKEVKNKKANEFSKTAHAIKSSCYNVGAKRCGELCFRLEALGAAGDVDGASQILAELVREFSVARIAIEQLPEMKKG